MNAPPVIDKPYRSLAGRLVGVVIAVCAGCALLAMLVQGWQVWRDSERAQVQATRDVVQVRMTMLAAALWDIDLPTVQRHVDEIARNPAVAGVVLQTPGGQVFKAGAPLASGRADVELPVPHPAAGGTPLGRLSIDFDRSFASTQLAEGLLRTGAMIGALAVLTGFLLIRFLRRELSEPLQQLADQMRKLSPDALDQTPVFERPERHWKDDIDQVAEAFDQLHGGLGQYVDERDAALQAMADERDRLRGELKQGAEELQRVQRELERTRLELEAARRRASFAGPSGGGGQWPAKPA